MRVNIHQYKQEFDSLDCSAPTVLNSANQLLLCMIRNCGEEDASEKNKPGIVG